MSDKSPLFLTEEDKRYFDEKCWWGTVIQLLRSSREFRDKWRKLGKHRESDMQLFPYQISVNRECFSKCEKDCKKFWEELRENGPIELKR